MTELSPAVSQAYDIAFAAAYGANDAYDKMQQTPNVTRGYEPAKRNHEALVSIAGAVFASSGILPPEYRPTPALDKGVEVQDRLAKIASMSEVGQIETEPLAREVLTEMLWVNEGREVEVANANTFIKFADHEGYGNPQRAGAFFSSLENALSELEINDTTCTLINGEEGRGIPVELLSQAAAKIRDRPEVMRSLKNSTKPMHRLLVRYTNELKQSLRETPGYDGPPLRERVLFGLDGDMYKLFVPPEEATRLRTVMEQWTPYARRTGESNPEPALTPDDMIAPSQEQPIVAEPVRQVMLPVETDKPTRIVRERNVESSNLWANFSSEFIDTPAKSTVKILTGKDSLATYFEQIARCAPLLNQKGEAELGQRIQTGNDAADKLKDHQEHATLSTEEVKQYTRLQQHGIDAQKMLTEANLRLVVSIAKRHAHFTNEKMDLGDLIQEGNIGLLRAVTDFDPSPGHRFSTYGTWWIRQRIRRSVSDQSRTIRIPVHMDETLSKYRTAQRELVSELGAEPTIQDMATRMGVTTNIVEELAGYARLDPLSLSMPLGKDGDFTLEDRIKSNEAVEDRGLENVVPAEIRRTASEVLNNDRLWQVVSMRNGLGGEEPMSLKEVGQRLGVTAERVRQLENQAMVQLRKYQEEFREFS